MNENNKPSNNIAQNLLNLALVSYKNIRRLFVLIIGLTVLLGGIVLIFLPGPAFIVIPLGLAILATEFLWARVLLHRMKDKIQSLTKNNIFNKKS